ncbi:hypothetical protein Scep_010289 [Stephania cephalantha]|uniref:Uncharacterized protein n=1 Tax=Stephania cephalantha TaxID=152367 RepID=A0AAP0JUR4_9MAGN
MKGLAYEVDDGRRISFWRDVWNGTRSIAEDFTGLFKLTRTPQATVADLAVVAPDNGWAHSWRHDFAIKMGDPAIAKFAALTLRL